MLPGGCLIGTLISGLLKERNWMISTCPDVLMIVVDSGRFDRLAFHGYPRQTTPFLGNLAERATDYMNAYAPAGATRFSISSVFLGVYPEVFGFSNGRLPSPEHTTVAQRLRRAGYDTFLFSSDPCVGPDTGLDRGFQHVTYIKPWSKANVRRPLLFLRHIRSSMLASMYRHRSVKAPVEILVSAAARAIRRRSRAAPPFFVYIHLDVHTPFISDRHYLQPFLEPGITEQDIRDVEAMQRQTYLYASPQDLKSPRKERLCSVFRSMYDASWYKTDFQIQTLVSALRRSDRFDSSMIVITSDHGECLGERDLFGHGPFPFEESMHLPLLVKYPEGVGPAPGRSNRLTSTIDIAPTICEITGCPIPQEEINGISLLDPSRTHEFVVNQRWMNRRGELEAVRKKYPLGQWHWYDLGHVIALRDKRYKFVWTSRGARYLFDMDKDPTEETNLLATNGRAAQEFEQRLERWRNGLVIREGWEEERLRPKRRPLDG